MKAPRGRPRERGFSYVALLIAVALIGALTAGAVSSGATMQRRVAEEELLFVGSQFKRAFNSYYAATPSGGHPYPRQLSDLLRDPRYPSPRRHLRKVFADPLTGQATWGLVEAPGGGIMGVYSLAKEVPIRVAGFSDEFASFAYKRSYAEWVFSVSQHHQHHMD
jgi:type II secretory pathway pseudopilin PulG